MTERTIRPSSLTTFSDCPRRFAARHMRDDVVAAGYDLSASRPSGAGALVGSGVHAGAAWTLEQMRAGGGAGEEGEAIDRAIEGFRERAAAEGAEWDDTTASPNTAEKQITRMTKVYRRQVAPLITPVLVEDRLEVTLAPGWILSGQVDSLTGAIERDNAEAVRDLKTGARKRANGVQYGAYSLILEAHGYAPKRLIEDFIPRVAIGREQPDATATEYNHHDARMDAWQALQAIQRDAAEFLARVDDPNGEDPRGAWRANPSSALCSEKFCTAHGSRWCRSHRPTES